MRGEIKDRYAAYAIGRINGWLSSNDVRKLENMNPIDGGDIYIIPLNMQPAFRKQNVAPGIKYIESRTRRSAITRRRIAKSFMPLFKTVETKIIKREIGEIKKAIKKYLPNRNIDDFEVWLNDFYKNQSEYMQKARLPAYSTMRELVKTEIADELDKSADDAADDNEFLSAYLKSHADKQTASRAGKIKEILNNSDTPLDDLTKNMDIWGEKIPDKTSLRETVQFSNAIARGIYAAYGIQRLK